MVKLSVLCGFCWFCIKIWLSAILAIGMWELLIFRRFTMNYVSIAIIAVVLFSFIVGLVKGFSKVFTKGICRLIAIVGAVAIAWLVATQIAAVKALIDNTLVPMAGGWFKSGLLGKEVASVDQLQELLSSQIVLSVFSGSAAALWAQISTLSVHTLGALLGKYIITIIVYIVLWLVAYLIVKYILFGIKYLLTEIAKVPVFNTIDKIVGAVVTTLIGGVISVGLVVAVIYVTSGAPLLNMPAVCAYCKAALQQLIGLAL